MDGWPYELGLRLQEASGGEVTLIEESEPRDRGAEVSSMTHFLPEQRCSLIGRTDV